jgi:hypothetical protein
MIEHHARQRRLVTLTTVCAALAIASAPPQAPKLDLSAKALAARASAYVADYQTKFAFLVADEHYRQTVTTGESGSVRQRVMNGELFLTFLPTDREWIAVHDVAEVDGRPVPDRDNLQTLLQRADVTTVARQVANRNATFNIGSVTRNFNEPTLALLVLEAKRIRQFRFSRASLDDRDGATIATLAFSEHDGPTLLHGTVHNAVYTKGEITIDADTGRVRRTVITFRDDKIDGRLATDYRPDDRLGLWVPSEFTERYDFRDRKRPEVTTCQATYTNYRRFEVTGRIKKDED